MRRMLLALVLPVALAACGADNKWASDADVQRFAYRSNEPPSITLFTAVSNSTGAGGHSAIMINGSQRVIWDPAGTWRNDTAPERHDLIYGITPQMLAYYIDYHARETYHVVEQKFYVTPAVAAQAMALAQGYGAVSKAMCTSSTSTILGQLPGFESIDHTYFPMTLMRKVDKLPGVQTVRYYDHDSDDNKGLLNSQLGGVIVVKGNVTTVNGKEPAEPPPGY